MIIRERCAMSLLLLFTVSVVYADTKLESAHLIGDPSVASDIVAYSVAADGQTVVLGAPYRNYAGYGYDSGALYLFEYQDGNWEQTQNLIGEDSAAFDYLGWSVDIENDVIAAGASWANETYVKSGGVYMFRKGKTWEQEALIVPSDLPMEANFGHSVDLDDNRLIVGAPYIDELVNAQGVAYIFRDDNGSWIQEARIVPGDAFVNFAGASVAIDGDYAVIGAPRDNADGVSAGSVFIYERIKGSWVFSERLTPNAPESYSYFGNEVDIVGGTILVGAEYSDIAGANTGAVVVFQHSGGAWSQDQILVPDEAWAWSHFGGSIDMQGSAVVIGAYGDPNSNGAAYLFRLGDNNQYEQTDLLMASDGTFGDRFGNSVAFGSELVVVGAPHWSEQQGSAYVFDLTSQPIRGRGAPRLTRNRSYGSARSGMSFEYFGNFDDHDYFFTSSEIEYYDAHEMANVLGELLNRPASLVCVNSPEESDFLQSISMDVFWIGLSDFVTEGTYAWDNGEPLDWTDWGPDEPNKIGGTEDVVAMNRECGEDDVIGWADWKEQHRYAYALIELEGEACTGDVDWDGDVDSDDLAITIDTWGDLGGFGDANHDGAVNVNDILWLLGYWGSCP
jgi:hypothetical protein